MLKPLNNGETGTPGKCIDTLLHLLTGIAITAGSASFLLWLSC